MSISIHAHTHRHRHRQRHRHWLTIPFGFVFDFLCVCVWVFLFSASCLVFVAATPKSWSMLFLQIVRFCCSCLTEKDSPAARPHLLPSQLLLAVAMGVSTTMCRTCSTRPAHCFRFSNQFCNCFFFSNVCCSCCCRSPPQNRVSLAWPCRAARLLNLRAARRRPFGLLLLLLVFFLLAPSPPPVRGLGFVYMPG